MEKSKKTLPIVLATALVSTPLVAAPQSAYAIDELSVDADDNTAGEESDYTIKFTLEDDLSAGDRIYIEFDSDFDLDDVSKSDIDTDFDNSSITVSGNRITIKVDEDLEDGDDVQIDIPGVVNPEDEGTYDVTVWTTNEDEVSEEVDIEEDGDSSSDDYDVEIDDNTEDAVTAYELGPIDLEDKLEEGKWITVTFPDEDMLPSDIDTDDVDINEYEPDDVRVDGKDVEIKIPSKADGKKTLTIKFYKSAGITNPSADDDYTINVEWKSEDYESETFDIKKSSSSSSSASSDFSVTLSDSGVGARSSYTFEADFGSRKLASDSDVIVEFPSADMVPGYLNPSDFAINGKTPRKVAPSGNKIYLTTPYSFTSSSKVKVDISYDAWLTNPKTAGSYQLKMTVDGKTITSKPFTISGTSVTPAPTPTPNPAPAAGTPAQVNNSTSTITLTNTAVGKPTGVNIAIKGVTMPLYKQRDFIEIVFPAGYRVPAYIAPANVTVNGVAANFVAVRGQNVLVYPAQDIPAGGAANVVIGAGANIINPSVKNAYSISVFTSEEKGLLFARAVGVGMPAPAQKPATPQPQPQPQPAVTVPANAALFKLNTPSFTLHGKSYPLQAAPYLANGSTTMVPAQFFKEALALTTIWNNNTVTIVSGTNQIKLTVGAKTARVNGKEVTLPAPVALKNNMPMIPIRFVTDSLGYKVGWDAKTSSVYVYR
ncbi:copper amine oxidase N-terminal domain-containing protein [Brevibacillus thermoruber]|uniref:copper amine oxidase N-terminal domain-containing protein n=1 Tax=Brevibacillus thermoruber TaxID=33942 RepID=UPI0005599289|nr:copper amine oxidase N-terminal domain-containing protein [Brevibacillus thermoruber]